MEKQDLKNLLENIYHLLAEEGEWHPPMLSPEENPNWSPLQPPPPPPWLSPIDPNYVAPRVDPILNPDGPGGGTIQQLNGRRFYVFPNGKVLMWDDSSDPPRWTIFYFPMLGDHNLPWQYVMPWWLGGTHTPQEWLDLINRSPHFQPQWPTNSNQ